VGIGAAARVARRRDAGRLASPAWSSTLHPPRSAWPD